MVFCRFSCSFAMVCLWCLFGFPMVLLFSPMVFVKFPMVFRRFAFGLAMVFLWFSCGVLMFLLCISYGYRIFSYGFPEVRPMVCQGCAMVFL